MSPVGLEGTSPLKPLALHEINQHMNEVFTSSTKPYLSGYKPNDTNLLFSSFATVNTSGVIEVRKMALVGSIPFFVASSVTAGMLVALLGAIVAITRPDQLEGFDLENIVRKVQINHHFDFSKSQLVAAYQESNVHRE
jgi:hypothetical protein